MLSSYHAKSQAACVNICLALAQGESYLISNVARHPRCQRGAVFQAAGSTPAMTPCMAASVAAACAVAALGAPSLPLTSPEVFDSPSAVELSCTAGAEGMSDAWRLPDGAPVMVAVAASAIFASSVGNSAKLLGKKALGQHVCIPDHGAHS